jgi:two-component system chemotaxis sensor kinase CheA
VRNAVDHGLECSQQREQGDNPRSARIELKASRIGSDLRVEVRDNGKGIDWERVRGRAIEKGFPAGHQQDLIRALFGGQLSTRDEVSETSGRGVGLNAVLLQVERLGGQMDVDSQPEAGCRFIVSIPSRALGVHGATPNGTDRSGRAPH